jgi:quercetin dioxygenase-like cupin family protein
MTLDKSAVEFHGLDIEEGWEAAPGAPPSIEQKLLSGKLDERNKVGTRTRLIRFQPGAVAPDQFVHDYWEEVYLISGELIVGNDEKGGGGVKFAAPSYACRPPGTYHGPFTSKIGCLFFEIQYYA